MPVFTYDTGGIGNYVIDGYNGYRLRLGASANDFSVNDFCSSMVGGLAEIGEVRGIVFVVSLGDLFVRRKVI